MNPDNFLIKNISSLEKVMLTKDMSFDTDFPVHTVAKNEEFSYQIAYKCDVSMYGRVEAKVSATVNGSESDLIEIFDVHVVPTEFAAPEGISEIDKNYITTEPGLFPDVLEPISKTGNAIFISNYWRSMWVNLKPQAKAGTYKINVTFTTEDPWTKESVSKSIEYELEVLDFELPKQTLIYTNWFHCDCLGSHYGVEIFGEKYWTIVHEYVKTAFEHGMNMILTPVLTPALDTEVGTERLTAQLVDITFKNGDYSFNFDPLGKWVKMCLEIGIEYFEFPPFFTQWGAKFCPKVVVNNVDTGVADERMFGWHTEATSPEYVNFLQKLVPALIEYLKSLGVDKNCYYHISDEPNVDSLDHYKKVQDIVKPMLEGYNIIDALSNIDFYKSGVVEHPIPANDHIEAFLEAKVPDLWTYYCISQAKHVSNRFFSMPSSRNRILGVQMFKYDIVGFLHWAYNFWNSQYSKRPVNPYYITDADKGFIGGDSFMVYPGDNERPVMSLRLKVFKELLDDMRAFQLLASLKSKDYVMSLIESDGVEITFSKYPSDPKYLLNLRNKVNRAIIENM